MATSTFLVLAALASGSWGCSHARAHPAETTLEATAGIVAPASSASPPSPLPPSAPPAASAQTPSFGRPTPIARYTCPVVQWGGPWRSFMAAADTRVAFVDGDDWLALVNRSPTGALPPEYAPADLVDIRDLSPRKPSECGGTRECLRSEAALGLKRLLDDMRAQGLEGHVQSAFRAFGTQCWVFASWAHQARGGFCEAAEQSALPGHSQHQLGTTLDLFTREWAEQGARTGEGVFRSGFGCSPGGAWLAENGWRFGFVVSYPIHPDDRRTDLSCAVSATRSSLINPKTGYKSEPWHLRFIGLEPAARFHDAWNASGPGTPDEITVEQWLRNDRGLVGDAELPVCDGCNCGACGTLSNDEARTPCGKAALWLDTDGHVVAPAEQPSLGETRASASGGELLIEAHVHAPAHTPTQTPVLDQAGPAYSEGSTFLSLVPHADAEPHQYKDLPGAWRLAAEPVPAGSTSWPWRASLASPEVASTWNRANVILPARSGDATVRIRIALPGTQRVRVALVRDGLARDVREVVVQ
jgi:D-alanyl-D-alanine carboxypeptidase